MKILNLVIHNSSNLIWNEMYGIQSIYYKNYTFVNTLFIEFVPHLEKAYILNNDRLLIKGDESLVPGLLQKTIHALCILNISDYDYCIRTNISTVINFRYLLDVITQEQSQKLHYMAGNLEELNWLDPASGIRDHRYRFLKFAQGTFIGMSRIFVKELLLNRHFLNYGVVDDVALGIFNKEFFAKEPIYTLGNRYFNLSNQTLNDHEFSQLNSLLKPIVFRNRSKNRSLDIQNIRFITEKLKRDLDISSIKND